MILGVTCYMNLQALWLKKELKKRIIML